MKNDWEEDQNSRQLLYGSILFQIFVPASTKIQTIWIVLIRKKFGYKECNLRSGCFLIRKFFFTQTVLNIHGKELGSNLWRVESRSTYLWLHKFYYTPFYL